VLRRSTGTPGFKRKELGGFGIAKSPIFFLLAAGGFSFFVKERKRAANEQEAVSSNLTRSTAQVARDE